MFAALDEFKQEARRERRALEIAAALPSAVHQPTEVWPILHEASPRDGCRHGHCLTAVT
jgi:hypothetical protein